MTVRVRVRVRVGVGVGVRVRGRVWDPGTIRAGAAACAVRAPPSRVRVKG